jgi:hypothetical protein
MGLTHSTAVRTAIAAVVKSAAEAAGSGANATTDFRSGSAPGCANAITGTQLALLALLATTYGAAGLTLALAGVPLSTTILASGNLGYFRHLDRNSAGYEEGNISTSSSDMNFSGGIAVLFGGTLTVSNLTVTSAP